MHYIEANKLLRTFVKFSFEYYTIIFKKTWLENQNIYRTSYY